MNFSNLREREGMLALAVQFCILTAARCAGQRLNHPLKPALPTQGSSREKRHKKNSQTLDHLSYPSWKHSRCTTWSDSILRHEP
jgi:hypothetical protein